MIEENIVEVNQISVYQENILILNNVSLTIRKGEFVYLVGKTGSGKSSFLKTLYAEIPVVDGSAKVAGYDLRLISRKEIPYLRRKIGIVFQDFQLLSDRTVSENLYFVMQATGWKEKPKMQARLRYVLEKVGLATKGFKMPNQLSGGEQQRVGIARALINEPEIILADEPTGNLDPETSEGILSLLKEINGTGTTVFMATHDYLLFRKFPGRTLRCEGGGIITDDTIQKASGSTY